MSDALDGLEQDMRELDFIKELKGWAEGKLLSSRPSGDAIIDAICDLRVSEQTLRERRHDLQERNTALHLENQKLRTEIQQLRRRHGLFAVEPYEAST